MIGCGYTMTSLQNLLLLLLSFTSSTCALFHETITNLTVSEDAHIGSTIGRLRLNPDRSYRISGKSRPFTVDLTSGRVWVSEKVDREEITNGTVNFILISTSPPSILHTSIQILDVNDNSPIFPLIYQNVSIVEMSPIGSRIPLLPAADPDEGLNGTIASYRIEPEGIFGLIHVPSTNKNDGDLLYMELLVPLDREKASLYSFNLTATDAGTPPRSSSTSIYLEVLDVNDNAPVFVQKELNITWNGLSNRLITRVEASDADSGANGEISYSIPSAVESEYFEIVNKNELKSKIDHPAYCNFNSSNSDCLLTVRAKDGGSPPLSSSQLIRIQLSAENLHSPQIHIKLKESNVDFAVVNAEAEKGAVVAVLSVTDEDGPLTEDASLDIIDGDHSSFFVLLSLKQFFVLHLKEKLKDSFPTVYDLGFRASDGQKPPRFSERSLRIYRKTSSGTQTSEDGTAWNMKDIELKAIPSNNLHIAEDSPIGSFVTLISTNVTGCKFRMITKNTPFEVDVENGVITTSASLFTTTKWKYEVEVSVLPPPPAIKPIEIFVTIRIDDVNDHAPTFLNLPSRIDVPEDISIGAQLLTFQVVDEDEGKNALSSVALISSEDSDYFRLSPSSSTSFEQSHTLVEPGKNTKSVRLVLQKSLDFEEKRQLTVEIRCVDDGGLVSTARLHIHVIDVNDNPPKFTCLEIYTTVPSLSPIGTEVVKVEASDEDEVSANSLRYIIPSASSSSSFSIDSKTGIVRTILSLSEASYTFQVTVIDEGLLTSPQNVTVFIKTTTANQVIPNLVCPDVLEISRKVASGQTIGHLKSNATTVTAQSDVISVARDGTIVLKKRIIKATGVVVLGRYEDITVSQCIKLVPDSDSGAPFFRERSSVIELSEDTVVGQPLLKVSACSHSLCEYTTTCIMLKVEQDGLVRVKSPLNSVDLMKCEITVFDSFGRSDVMSLEVKRLSNPALEKLHLRRSYYFGLKENLNVGYIFGSFPKTSAYYYRMISPTANGVIGLFPDGKLYVRRRLNQGSKTVFKSTIEAYHRITNSTYTTELTVKILSLNAHAPSCIHQTFKVQENLPFNSFIGLVQAFDEDEGPNGILRYELINQKDHFLLCGASGQLKSLHPFDYEKTHEVSVSVNIFDNGTPSRNQTCNFKVEVRDLNDNSPTFDQPFYSITVDTSDDFLYTVNAKDVDSGDNGLVSYELANFQNIFKINQTNGELRAIAPLKSKSIYNISVVARDNGENSRASKTFVVLRTSLNASQLPYFSSDELDFFRINMKDHKVGSVIGHMNVQSDLPVQWSSGDPRVAIDSWGKLILVDGRDLHYDFNASFLASSKAGKASKTIKFVVEHYDEEASDIIHVKENLVPFVLREFSTSDAHIVFTEPSCESFAISENRLILQRPLDREMTPSYRILIKEGTVHHLLTVVVDDVNDNEATCQEKTMIVTIIPSDIALSCSDPDSSDDDDLLILNTSDSRVKVTGRTSFKLEHELDDVVNVIHYKLQDQGQSSTITLIRGGHDPSIVFPSNHFSLLLSSATKLSESFGRITAESPIPVQYFVIGTPSIEIDRFSGELVIMKEEALRRSRNITVVAASARGIATTEVSIEVIEDSLHVTSSAFILKVPRNQVPSKIIGRIDVGRNDVHLIMDDLFFTIASNNVVLRRTIPEYLFPYNVSVEARKGRLSAVLQIMLLSEPEKLDDKVLNFWVRENSDYGTIVGQLSIDNDEHIWELVEDIGLVIDSQNRLVTTRIFDREEFAVHVFNIRNTRTGHLVQGQLLIEDENDNVPTLESKTISYSVYEDASIGYTVGRVRFDDKDINNIIHFDIIKGNELDLFNIYSDGRVYLNNMLDYEISRIHNLSVVLTDGVAPFRCNTVPFNIIVNVVDVNDNAPTLSSSKELFVFENTKVGTTVGKFIAEDLDSGNGGKFQYRIVPTSLPFAEFYVNAVTGELKINKLIDYEKSATIVFELELIDFGSPSLSTVETITVHILDVNDFSPKLSAGPRVIEVSELSGVGQVIHQFAVTDDDGTDDNKLGIYFLEDTYDGLFNILPLSGQLVVASSVLDFERKAEYNLTVNAQNIMGGEIDQQNVTVRIMDENDEPPRFIDGCPVHFELFENSIAPAIVGSTVADDDDAGENGLVAYSIVEGNMTMFGVNSTSGVITSLISLDREEKSEHKLRIQVTDSGRPRLSSTCDIIITVLDENDNVPLFDQPYYQISIVENAPNNTFLMIVRADDRDSGENGQVSYRILTNDRIPFSIDAKSGVLSTFGIIDREDKDSYTLKIEASDHGRYRRHTNTVLVKIYISDINDNSPTILNSQLDVFVPSSVVAGDIMHIVNVHDPDLNEKLSYSLSGLDSNSFAINDFGEISATTQWVPSKSYYSITVTVTDSNDQNTSASFTYYIQDPSQFPRFTVMPPRISIKEQRATDIFQFHAEPSKPSLSDPITYSILSGNGDDGFEINPISGVVTSRKTIDREKKVAHKLWIQATNGQMPPKSSWQSLTLIVEDINDNHPVFEKVVYEAEIEENFLSSEPLLRVHATDLDEDVNAIISYSIIGGNERNMFSINEETGDISCLEELDREVEEVHKLLIMAKDHGEPPLNSTAVVRIRVTDVDDNSPRFTRIFYRNLKEDSPIGTEVLQIVATDVDATENYTFTLENYNDVFSINDRTGVITLLKPLDRENTSSYRLMIRVDDGSWTIRTNAMITIDDINDNSPVFEQAEYFFLIKESTTNLTDKHIVIATLNATDSDFGVNGEIRYNLYRDSSYITIDAETGQLNLISYPLGLIEVLIIATDNGQPALSSNCTVKILWQPVASARPQKSLLAFKSSTPDVAIGRMTDMHEILGVFPTDVILVLNKKDIHLVHNVTYQQFHRTQLHLIALSEFNELIYQPLELLVSDEIVKPSFPEERTVLTISESAPVGSELIALDASAGNPLLKQTLHYEVLESNQAFRSTSSGLVLLSSPNLIDYESHRVVNMTVEASSGGYSSVIALEIHILDDDDNVPVFVVPTMPQLVTSEHDHICMQAVDADSDSFGLVEFVTASEDIQLDSESGCFKVISAKKSFQAEISALSGEDTLSTCIVDVVNLAQKVEKGKNSNEKKLLIRREVCTAAPNNTLILEVFDDHFIYMEPTTDAYVRRSKEVLWAGQHYDHSISSKSFPLWEFERFTRKVREVLLEVQLNSYIAPAPIFERSNYFFDVKLTPYKNLVVHNFNWILPTDCRAVVIAQNEIIPPFCLATDGTLRVCRQISAVMYGLTLKIYQGNATVSSAFVEVRFNELEDKSAISQIVYLRENIRDLDIIQLSDTSNGLRINDSRLSQSFAILNNGMLVTTEAFDRERLGVYQIPIVSEKNVNVSRKRSIVVIVDDEVDSPDVDSYDVQVIAIGKYGIEGNVHPASTDSSRDFKCLSINQAEFTVNTSCFLRLVTDEHKVSSVSLMASDGLMPYKYSVSWKRLSPSADQINASEHMVAVNLLGPTEGVAEMLSLLQSSYPDLTILPIAIVTNSIENRTVVLSIQDRHQNFLIVNDALGVIDKFQQKSSLNSVLFGPFWSLSSLCQLEEWSCQTDYRCIPSIVLSDDVQSFRSLSTVWLLPLGSLHTRCECIRPNGCRRMKVKQITHPDVVLPKNKTTPAPIEKDSCSTYDCGKHGRCVETSTKKVMCHCDGGYTADNCDQDEAATTLSSSLHVLLKPTSLYRHLVDVEIPNRKASPKASLSPQSCEDGREQIEMDFKTDTDHLFPLLTLDYGDIRAIVQLRHAQLVYMVTDGYRNPIEIALSPIVADDLFHTFSLELSADRKTMTFQVDGAGKEARSMKPMPELLSKSLKKVIIGSSLKKMEKARVVVKKLLINRQLQSMDTSTSAQQYFVAAVFGKPSDLSALSNESPSSGSSATSTQSSSSSSLNPGILASLIGISALAACILLTLVVWKIWSRLTTDPDPTVSSGGWKPAKEFRTFPKSNEGLPFESVHRMTNSSMSSSLKMTSGSSGHFNTAMTLSVTSLPKSDDGYEVPVQPYSDTHNSHMIYHGSRRDISPKSSSAHYDNSYY